MKTMKILLTALLVCSFVQTAQAARTKSAPKKINASEDIDTLGGNKDLMDMAGRIQSTSRSRIVQERIVDRRNKVELGLSYGGIMGGDAYLRTQSIGFSMDYHITPRWSIGGRYYDFGSSLTPEGERIKKASEEAKANGGIANPFNVDTPQSAMMAVVNWYPIYGKTSFLDLGVTQFDLYLLAGGGSMELASGNTGLYTAGLGVGAWMSRHLSIRSEIRYQKYDDMPDRTVARSVDTAAATISIGWIL